MPTELTIGRGLVEIADIPGDRPGIIIHPRKSPDGPSEMVAPSYVVQDDDVILWIDGPSQADALLKKLMPYLSQAAIGEPLLEVMARAHDREESAQKGEPSPWDFGTDEDDFPEFREERIAAMRCAVQALAKELGLQ